MFDRSNPVGLRPDRPVDAVRADFRYRELRTRRNRFVALATLLFLGWYGLFVGLSAFAPALMAVRVAGFVNLGFVLGLAQFASTLLIIAVFRRFARREIDPRVAELRAAHGGLR